MTRSAMIIAIFHQHIMVGLIYLAGVRVVIIMVPIVISLGVLVQTVITITHMVLIHVIYMIIQDKLIGAITQLAMGAIMRIYGEHLQQKNGSIFLMVETLYLG